MGEGRGGGKRMKFMSKASRDNAHVAIILYMYTLWLVDKVRYSQPLADVLSQ